MTYNSYSNYQRMHSLSNHSYIDGVPMAISEQFKPPPRIKLPRMPARHVCDIIELEYDFSLERKVLADAESRKMAEIAETEANRVASAMDDLSRAESPDKPKDPGKPSSKKSDTPAWTVGPEILTPTPMTVPRETVKGPEKSQFRVKDFETVDDPFDDLELKVLDDMAELKSVLDVVQQSASPTQHTTSPSLENSSNEQTNEKRAVVSVSVPSRSSQEADVVPDVPPERQEENIDVSDNLCSPRLVANGILHMKALVPPPIKRKPVNLDDYNISLPNTDHLMAKSHDNTQKSWTGSAGVNLRQYVTGNNMTSLPMTNCVPYTAHNGFNHPQPWTNDCNSHSVIPVNGSKSESDAYSKPGQNYSTSYSSSVIGQVNGNSTSSVIGPADQMTFDQYRYAGYKMRSARSASDLRKLANEEEASYLISHSPPPRTPFNQTRIANRGRHSLSGPADHSPLTNQRSLPSTSSVQHSVPSGSQRPVTSLLDPFTSLNAEEQDFVGMFVDMGFPRPRTSRAVKIFGKDSKQVTDYLCLCDGLVEQGYPADHVELAAQLADNQIKQAKDYLKVMRQLQDFGFPQSDIHKALRLHHADTDKCLDYLTAPT